MPASATAIKAVGLRRDHGRRAVLRDVTFELPWQHIAVLLGPNGAGKTTLLNLCATLLRPHAGELSVAGHPLPDKRDEVRRHIGLVSHQSLLYPTLTVRENLQFFAGLFDVRPSIDSILEELGLSADADRPVRVLSRGLMQRASLARAVLHSPRVLLLDEPFTGLDTATAATLIGLLQRLRTSGCTVLLSSHDPERERAYADSFLELREGRL